MERKADVELATEQPAGNLSAEGLAGDDGQVRAVVLDRGEDRAKRLVPGHRRIAETHGAGDPLSGEAGAFRGAFERSEREWCLLEQRSPGRRELDLTARTHEQIRAKGAFERADLIA